jgi:hypothetical protein
MVPPTLCCKLIGLKNSGSWRKFMCRQEIATLIHYAEHTGGAIEGRMSLRTNTNLRVINAIFHPDVRSLRAATGIGSIEALYYFYMRMEDNPEVDASFQPFIDAAE